MIYCSGSGVIYDIILTVKVSTYNLYLIKYNMTEHSLTNKDFYYLHIKLTKGFVQKCF